MIIVNVTNLVNHHQIPLADELYRQIGHNYFYIATTAMPDSLIKGGYNSDIIRPYIIKSYENDESMSKARNLIDNADVVIAGDAPSEWFLKRKKANMITFHYSERWLKVTTWKNFAPKNLFRVWKNYFQFRKKHTYMLCASAFTKIDVYNYCCFPNKCFKWGYFTKVETSKLKISIKNSSIIENTPIMWCSRFISWKHPELPIQLAVRLKDKGYHFKLDMYGSGEELDNTIQLAKDHNVEDVVTFKGNLPNNEILDEMRNHKIFLFTSDHNEGWGAVANEAMSNGCVVVGSDQIGSIPFLIKDGVNGLIFKSEDINSLVEKVSYLLNNKSELNKMSDNAMRTLFEEWSPEIAAKRLLTLIEYIQNDKLLLYNEMSGPASWA